MLCKPSARDWVPNRAAPSKSAAQNPSKATAQFYSISEATCRIWFRAHALRGNQSGVRRRMHATYSPEHRQKRPAIILQLQILLNRDNRILQYSLWQAWANKRVQRGRVKNLVVAPQRKARGSFKKFANTKASDGGRACLGNSHCFLKQRAHVLKAEQTQEVHPQDWLAKMTLRAKGVCLGQIRWNPTIVLFFSASFYSAENGTLNNGTAI